MNGPTTDKFQRSPIADIESYWTINNRRLHELDLIGFAFDDEYRRDLNDIHPAIYAWRASGSIIVPMEPRIARRPRPELGWPLVLRLGGHRYSP